MNLKPVLRLSDDQRDEGFIDDKPRITTNHHHIHKAHLHHSSRHDSASREQHDQAHHHSSINVTKPHTEDASQTPLMRHHFRHDTNLGPAPRCSSRILMMLFATVVIALHTSPGVDAYIDGLYCGLDNCYEILGVTRETPHQEIVRAYRRLARKWHPDMHKGETAKEEATLKFQELANAYEVVKDEDSRRDYDYMLDNPDEFYAHYYRYYRRMYAPKVDVRYVIVVTLTVISAIQYWAGHAKYKEAIDYFLTVPKYRLRAQEIARQDGLLPGDESSVKSKSNGHAANGTAGAMTAAAYKKKNRNKTKEEIRQEEEEILRRIIEEQMDIKGAYAKPTWQDVLWVQLVILPYTLYQYASWFIRWHYKFTYKGEEYGEEEKEYLIRRHMKMSASQWDSQEDEEREEWLHLELWRKDKFKEWKKQKDDELKAQLAQKGSYKRYRRYMKKGGPGQITFMED